MPSRRCAGAMLPLLAWLVLFLVPARSAARDPLRCELKKASEQLRDWCAKKGFKAVSLGEVRNTDPKTPSTAGPGLSQILREELERAGVPVKLRANVGLAVAYRGRKVPLATDRKVQRLVVDMRFTASFEDSQEDLDAFQITNEEAVRHILGLTVTNTAKGKAREQETVLAFAKPQVHLDKAVVLAGDKSPFGIEIIAEGNALTPVDEDGLALVKLRREQTYAIRLINRSPNEVAVRLSIDGFNIFTFSELRHKAGPYKGAPLYDMVLLPPKEERILIRGWHRTNDRSDKFKITEYAGTAAAKMKKATDIGTITATFCAAWDKTPPADELDGARAPGDDGTGFGEATTMKYTAVKRTIGAVRGSVTVRYKVPLSR